MSLLDFLSPVLFVESMLIMSFVISPCRWLCGYGWQLLMKSTPSKILPDFKPCHALPLMSSAQSEAAVTFWSLRFPFPSPQGLSEKITWCWWLQLLIFQTAVSDLTLPGPATLFSPPLLNVSHLGQDQIFMRGWSTGLASLLCLWSVMLSRLVSRGTLGLSETSCWWVAELAAEKASFDASFFIEWRKRLSTWFCHVKQLTMKNTLDACLTGLPQSFFFFPVCFCFFDNACR